MGHSGATEATDRMGTTDHAETTDHRGATDLTEYTEETIKDKSVFPV